MKLHIIYAGYHYDHGYHNSKRLRSLLLEGMKKYKIKSFLFTLVTITKQHLITKETAEQFRSGSINDDIEFLFNKLRFGETPEPVAWSHFIPQLNENELKIVQQKDFMSKICSDDEETQSFVYGKSKRRTSFFTIKKRNKLRRGRENTYVEHLFTQF